MSIIEAVQFPRPTKIRQFHRTASAPLAYVASGYALRQSAEFQQALQTVQDLGYQLSYPWWENEEFTAEKALEDVVGVMRADILVMFMPYSNYIYRGVWVEMGIALALNKPVYIVGDVSDSQCIFLLLPGVRRGYPPRVV